MLIHSRCHWLTVALLVSLVGPAPAEPQRLALLVGVRDYESQQLCNLNFTENDVVDLAALLKEKGGYQVTLLTQGAGKLDLKPTAHNIRKHLEALLQKAAVGDHLLVAFSGHGVHLRTDREGEDSFFCPMDAKLADPKNPENLIALGQVYRALSECKADIKVLLVDACRNNPFVGKGAGDGDFEPLPPPKGMAALFSCSKGQKSYESEKRKHGVFFWTVIEGLQGEAMRGGKVTFDDLVAYVSAKVPDLMREDFQGKLVQVPARQINIEGVVQLVAAKESPQPNPRPMPGILPAAKGVLLDESFKGIEEGKMPAGWTHDAGLTVSRGNPEKGIPPGLMPQAPGEYCAETPTLPIRGDFAVEAEFAADSNLNILLQGQSGGRDLRFFISPDPYGNWLVSYPGLDTKGTPRPPNRPSRIRLEREGNLYRVYVNGAVVHSRQSTDYASFSRVQVRLSGANVTRFHQLRVTVADPEGPRTMQHPVLLDEDFREIRDGEKPRGWTGSDRLNVAIRPGERRALQPAATEPLTVQTPELPLRGDFYLDAEIGWGLKLLLHGEGGNRDLEVSFTPDPYGNLLVQFPGVPMKSAPRLPNHGNRIRIQRTQKVISVLVNGIVVHSEPPAELGNFSRIQATLNRTDYDRLYSLRVGLSGETPQAPANLFEYREEFLQTEPGDLPSNKWKGDVGVGITVKDGLRYLECATPSARKPALAQLPPLKLTGDFAFECICDVPANGTQLLIQLDGDGNRSLVLGLDRAGKLLLGPRNGRPLSAEVNTLFVPGVRQRLRLERRGESYRVLINDKQAGALLLPQLAGQFSTVTLGFAVDADTKPSPRLFMVRAGTLEGGK